MIILTLRTDKPEAEIGLYDSSTKLAYRSWQAHRELAETLHSSIRELMEEQGKQLSDIEGIVVFKGPGSFTGLRIGLTVANAFASSLDVPIIGRTGAQWRQNGITALLEGHDEQLIMPEYGAVPHITAPKH